MEERNLFCANMLLWDRPEFYPYEDVPEAKPILKVNLLASIPRQGFETKIKSIFDSTDMVKHCFSKLEFTYPDHDSINEFINKEPNLSFINSLAHSVSGIHLRLNVACLVLRRDWLKLINEQLSDQNVWIISSIYEGVSALDKDMGLAIHPCGIYYITQEFKSFVHAVWKPIVKKYSLQSSDLNPVEMLYRGLDDNTFSHLDVAAFKTKFIASDMCSNHDGVYENKHYDGVALRRLLRNKSNLIGISKHLFRELETIDISYGEYRKIVRQHFKAD